MLQAKRLFKNLFLTHELMLLVLVVNLLFSVPILNLVLVVVVKFLLSFFMNLLLDFSLDLICALKGHMRNIFVVQSIVLVVLLFVLVIMKVVFVLVVVFVVVFVFFVKMFDITFAPFVLLNVFSLAFALQGGLLAL